MRADYVIVGGGSAGCLIASKLSEDPSNTVLLLEAGGNDDYIWIHIPMGYVFTMNNPRVDWCFETTPQPGLGMRTVKYPRGKVLGGCSSINGMVYQRGNRGDYDSWAELNPGWAWDDVLPRFCRLMDYHKGDTECGEFHAGGPWRVEGQRASWEVLDHWLRASVQAGVPFNPHFMDSNAESVGYYNVNQISGRRLSSYRAFLDAEARERPNLRILSHATTSRVIVDGRAVGAVEFNLGDDVGTTMRAVADKEVVMSAGAIGTPHLLQVSGIGDPVMLARYGVDTKYELPGVGYNLHDHLQLRPIFRLKDGTKTMNSAANSLVGRARMGLQYLLNRTGPLASAPSQLGLFAKSDPSLVYPDLQYHIQPLSLDQFGQPLHTFPGLTASVCNLRPTSRGTLELRSPDIRVPPAINPNYLATEEDRVVAARSIRHARRIAHMAALGHLEPTEHVPGADLVSDEELIHAAGAISTSIFHPVGTCKMGPASDPMAVVDHELRVHGLEGLRIVDASIMPQIVSGNTNSPTLMIADKASELILGAAESVVDDNNDDDEEGELEAMACSTATLGYTGIRCA